MIPTTARPTRAGAGDVARRLALWVGPGLAARLAAPPAPKPRPPPGSPLHSTARTFRVCATSPSTP